MSKASLTHRMMIWFGIGLGLLTLVVFFVYLTKDYAGTSLSYVRWMLLLMMGGYLGAMRIAIGAPRHQRMPLSGWFSFAFIVWMFVSGSLSERPLVAYEKAGAFLITWGATYLMLRRVFVGEKIQKAISILLVISVFIFLNLFFTMDLFQTQIGTRRVVGDLNTPNLAAISAMVLVFFTVVQIAFRLRKKSINLFSYLTAGALLLLSLVTIVGAGTRSVFLGVGAGFVAERFSKGFLRTTILIILATPVLMYFGGDALEWYRSQQTFQREEISTGRIDLYKQQIDILGNHLFFGTGVGVPVLHEGIIRDVRAGSHNSYLGSTVETGVFGGLLFLGWVGMCMLEAYRYARRSGSGWVADFVLLYVVGFAAVATVELILFTVGNPLMVAFYALVATIPSTPRGTSEPSSLSDPS